MSKQKKNKKAKSHSLEAVARRELGLELDKVHQKADWGGELSPSMIEYAAKDAQVLLPIAETFDSKINNAGLERVYEIEHRALPAVLWMQNTGLPFDGEGWKDYLAQVEEEIKLSKDKLNTLAPSRPRGGRVELELASTDQRGLRPRGNRTPKHQRRNPHQIRAPSCRHTPRVSQGFEDHE